MYVCSYAHTLPGTIDCPSLFETRAPPPPPLPTSPLHPTQHTQSCCVSTFFCNIYIYLIFFVVVVVVFFFSVVQRPRCPRFGLPAVYLNGTTFQSRTGSPQIGMGANGSPMGMAGPGGARPPHPPTEAAISAVAGTRASARGAGSTECRYGTGCKRADCSYNHPQGETPYIHYV